MKIFGYDVGVTPLLLALVAIIAVAIAAKYLKEGFDASEKNLVLYFAPWCGHCKTLKPEWEKLSKAGIKGVTISEVNADDEKEKAKEAGVDGFPTIILYNKGEQKVYSGARTAEAISKWALNN
jgi:protein disulfide-isomerase-like protein